MRTPTAIGRYELVRRIGAGGMGVVYEAKDSRDEKTVALKVLLPHAAEEAEGLLRFKREFRALARLRHPNIVRVYDAGIEDDTPFIAMELVAGKDVRTYLRSIPEGPNRDRETVRILRQIFGALAHIHARRIVHRDLKPENILVSDDGRVKLMDFGVARLLRAPSSSSGLLGTFAYMAPEQVTTGEIDGRSDLYALGVLLYEILTNKYPFPVEPPAAALHHHVNTPPEPVRQQNPSADPVLARLTEDLLKKDPLERPQSAEEAQNRLAGGDRQEKDFTTSLPGRLFVPRFVGRDDDLDLLDGLVSDASAGRGRLLLIEGPSGVGKTRLVEEVKKRVERRAHVLIGQCAQELAQDYAGIVPMLDAIAGIAQRASSEVVKRIVGRDAALVSVISPRLAKLGGPASSEHLAPSDRKIRVHKAVVGVIGRLSLTKPVILVFEDLHWADPLSVELLWDAARTLLAPRPGGMPEETVCPVAVVLTRRPPAEGPDRSEGLVRQLEANGTLERRVLGALGKHEVAEMLRTMTGIKRPLPALIQELISSTQGLPLMVQEVTQSWLESQELKREHGVWLFRDRPVDLARDESVPTNPRQPGIEEDTEDRDQQPEALDTPLSAADRPRRPAKPRTASIAAPPRGSIRRTAGAGGDRREMVLGKLKSLGGPARDLLERLALLGRRLPSDLVQALAGMEEVELLDAIDELVRSKLLVEDVSPDGVRYRFYHEGFRDAVVHQLPRARREALHLILARSLERRFLRRRGELAHVLARHFREGGHQERAVRYLMKVAKNGASFGDLDGALRRLDDAMSILDQGPITPASATRRLRVVLQRIELLREFGQPREAMEHADPSAAMSARDPELMRAELLLGRATCQFALGKLDETLATLGRMPRPSPSRSLAARGLQLEGHARIARGEYARARTVLGTARDIASDAGLTDLVEPLEAKIGVVLLHQGDYAGSLLKLEAALKRERDRGQVKNLADLLGHIGMIHRAQNHATEALACYREALELAEARGQRQDKERWAGALGTLMTDLGDFEGAQSQLLSALTVAQELGNKQGEATWHGELGVRHFRANDPEAATTALNRCLAISRGIGFARYEAWALLHLGALLIGRDKSKLKDAKERLERGLEIAEELGNEELRILGLLFLGQLRRAEGQPQKAKETWERADVMAMASQNILLRARIQRELEGL